MGAEGAVNILYRKSSAEEKQEIIKEYESKVSPTLTALPSVVS